MSLFPPGIDPSKIYNPLMEMPDPRAIHPHPHGPYLKKKSKCKYIKFEAIAFGMLVYIPLATKATHTTNAPTAMQHEMLSEDSHFTLC